MAFMYNFGLTSAVMEQALMEAEQLNLIANRLADLAERNNALRGYL
jgi:hypothetical protein